MFETVGMTLERTTNPHTAAAEIADVVNEIRSGSSPEGFRWLHRRYCAPVTQYFRNRGFSDQEADDLAQETFVRVYRSIGGFRSDSSFETWLFSIVKNVWKNALRTLKTQKRDADEVPLNAVTDADDGEATFPEPPDPLRGPLDQVLADERNRLLYRALDELPERMRQCILLRIGQDLKYREIAALMQVSIATVKSQLNLAKQRLGPLLEPHSDVLS